MCVSQRVIRVSLCPPVHAIGHHLYKECTKLVDTCTRWLIIGKPSTNWGDWHVRVIRVSYSVAFCSKTHMFLCGPSWRPRDFRGHLPTLMEVGCFECLSEVSPSWQASKSPGGAEAMQAFSSVVSCPCPGHGYHRGRTCSGGGL